MMENSQQEPCDNSKDITRCKNNSTIAELKREMENVSNISLKKKLVIEKEQKKKKESQKRTTRK